MADSNDFRTNSSTVLLQISSMVIANHLPFGRRDHARFVVQSFGVAEDVCQSWAECRCQSGQNRSSPYYDWTALLSEGTKEGSKDYQSREKAVNGEIDCRDCVEFSEGICRVITTSYTMFSPCTTRILRLQVRKNSTPSSPRTPPSGVVTRNQVSSR